MSRRKIKSKKKSSDVIPFPFPDRRLNEQTLADLGGAYQSEDSRSTAQELVWEAFEQGNIKKRVSLAKEALAIYPDCVDAYNILAENSASIQQAMEYYKKASRPEKGTSGKKRSKRTSAISGEYWQHDHICEHCMVWHSAWSIWATKKRQWVELQQQFRTLVATTP